MRIESSFKLATTSLHCLRCLGRFVRLNRQIDVRPAPHFQMDPDPFVTHHRIPLEQPGQPCFRTSLFVNSPNPSASIPEVPSPAALHGPGSNGCNRLLFEKKLDFFQRRATFTVPKSVGQAVVLRIFWAPRVGDGPLVWALCAIQHARSRGVTERIVFIENDTEWTKEITGVNTIQRKEADEA